MPSFSSAGRWAEARRWPQHGQAVERDLGADDGVLMVDGRALPQPGVHSAGVKRPYGGERGQRATGPAGVWVGAVSTPGSPWRDRRRDGPEAWVTDDA
jgi:hypothetical protein